MFPQIYADCASGINDQGTDLGGRLLRRERARAAWRDSEDQHLPVPNAFGPEASRSVPGWRHWSYTLPQTYQRP